MARTRARQRLETPHRPVRLFWQRSEDGDIVPALSITHPASREQIFDHFEVGSIDELAADALSASHRQRCKAVRLGVVVETGDEETYLPERELLALVEDIDASLADHLIEWYDDIPSLCEALRRDQYLSALFNDVRVEQGADGEWVDDLAAGPALERRMNRAGVWIEPDPGVVE
jgi:hypothetical protein